MPSHVVQSLLTTEPNPATMDAIVPITTLSGTSPARRPLFGIAAGRAGYIVAAMSIFIIGLLWGAVAYELNHDRDAVIGTARNNTDNLARAYSEHVLGAVRLLDQMMIRARSDYENHFMGSDPVAKLRQIVNPEADSVTLGIIDEGGHLITNSKGQEFAGSLAVDREFFQVQAHEKSDTIHVSAPISSKLANRQVIILTRRITQPNGDFAGVVYVSFDTQYLSGFFTDLALSRNSSFAIFDRNLTILDMIRGWGHDTTSIGKSVAGTIIERALAQAPAGHYEVVAVTDGIERIYSYRALLDYPLVVSVGIAKNDILAGFRWRQSRLIGVAIALSIFFVAAALYQLRRITKNVRSERALLQTQALLLQSQRVAKLGYFLHDMETDLVFWSDSLFDLRRVPRRDSFARHESAQFIDQEDRDRYCAAQKAAFNKHEAFSFDVRVHRPDGTVYWEHRVVQPQVDARGKIVRALGVIQDITESKETEIVIARSRDNMARAQHVALLGSFDFDLVTKALDWSDEMYSIYGLDKSKTVPSQALVAAVIHPDDKTRFQAAIERGVVSKNPGTQEYRIVRPNGDERILHAERALEYDAAGRPIRVHGSVQDITERRAGEERERELERKLVQSQKLEALGTLAGGIAHDLNNTLTPIMALSKITARKLEPGILRTNIETIYAASLQAGDLVKRVLAFSRQDIIEKKPINLHDSVNESITLLRATIPTSIDLKTQIDDVPFIMSDPSQIQQVVTNLVTNAAHAIGNRVGTITITLGTLTAGPERIIHLSVTDTGEGMDEATRTRIFEPFFTKKAVGQGTGLGLSIVAGIVADHGGRIEVASEPGQGARFDLYFPVSEPELSAAA